MESSRNFQSTQKPAGRPLQGDDRVKTPGNAAEIASSKDGKRNTANPPPKETVVAPKSEPAHK